MVALAIGAAGLAVVAAAVGLSLALTGGRGVEATEPRRVRAPLAGNEHRRADAGGARALAEEPMPAPHREREERLHEWAEVPDPHLNNMPQNIYNLRL